MSFRRPGCFVLPRSRVGRTRALAVGLGWLGALAVAAAQEGSTTAPPLGFVTLESATVSGALEVTGDKAVVRGGGVITARDRTAALELNRGGMVNVCATSSLHVTAGSAAMARPPLLLALDRGAIEIHMQATARDVLITPDLRFSVTDDGPLDLRVRVTPNGDTCVEHKGLQAPKLEIVDTFGDGHYELRAGQHVLFEHGSLREVVDRETSPCGCPEVPVVSVANNGGTGGRPAAPGALVGTAAGPEAQHPFPAAESEGLTTESAAAKVPATTPGVPHAQVAATLAYGATGSSDGTGALPAAGAAEAGAPSAGTSGAAPGDAAATSAPAASSAGGGAAGAAASPAPAATATPPTPAPTAATATGVAANPGKTPETGSVSAGRAAAPPAAAPPGANDLAHRIGHFFRKIFGGG